MNWEMGLVGFVPPTIKTHIVECEIYEMVFISCIKF